MSSRSSLRLLPLLLGVLLVWAFVARIGVRAIFDELSRLGPDALWILVPYAVGTALSGLPWAWLLEPSQRPRSVDAVASRFAASGANALLPFFGLAGEPCRLLWLSQGARAEGLAAIVVDRLLYNSMGGLWLVLGASAGLATRLPRVVSGSAAAVGVLVFCGSLLVLHGFSRWRMARGVQRVLQRLLGNAQRDPELGARVDAALHRLLEGRARPVLVRGLLLHFAARVVSSAELAVALWSLHAPAQLADALVLSSVPIATSVVASSIPSQVGVQEGAQAFVCAALGFDPALGLVLVLLQRLRQLAFVPLTLFLLSAGKARGLPEAVARGPGAPSG